MRRLMDKRLSKEGAFTEEDSSLVDKHLAGCEHCRHWSRQTEALIDAAASMRQFDVPEAVTQRIVSAIENEPAHNGAYVHMVLPGLALLAAMIVFVILESGESVAGLLAWGIGLGLMASLKLFLGHDKEVGTAAR